MLYEPGRAIADPPPARSPHAAPRPPAHPPPVRDRARTRGGGSRAALSRRRARGPLRGRRAARRRADEGGQGRAGRGRRRGGEQWRRRPGVLSATANYVAHLSGWVPGDPGHGGRTGGLAADAVELPGRDRRQRARRVAHLQAVGRPGGRGVTVAVLDTGVAYSDRGPLPPLAGLLAAPLRPRLGLRGRGPVPERRQRPRHARRGHDRREHRQRRSGSPGSPTASG